MSLCIDYTVQACHLAVQLPDHNQKDAAYKCDVVSLLLYDVDPHMQHKVAP